jgi:hypothetical protein
MMHNDTHHTAGPPLILIQATQKHRDDVMISVIKMMIDEQL